MSHDLQRVERTSEPTDARFTIRALFVVMTFVAVLAAIGGAVLDRFSADEQSRIVVFWGIWVVAVAGCIAIQFWRRRRAERLGGPILLRVPAERGLETTRTYLYFLLLAVLVMLYLSLGISLTMTPPGGGGMVGWFNSVAFPILISVWPIAQFAPAMLWQRDVRFCESGIVWGQQVLPWDELMEHRWGGWGENRLELFGLRSVNNKPSLQIALPADAKPEIDALLAKMIARVPFAAARVRNVGVGQVPVWTVFKTPHLRHHLGRVLVGLVCGAGLLALALTRNTGQREFDEALRIGFFTCAFLIYLQLRWIGRNAGQLVVRVFARRDWLGLIANIVGAVAIYMLVERFVLPWGWLGYAGGFAYCFLAINTVIYFFVTQLDLHRGGLVMPRAFCWPWEKVRLLKWDRETSGRLVFRHGLRRVHATVLPEQREAVDAMLAEKFGLSTSQKVLASRDNQQKASPRKAEPAANENPG